VAAVFSRRTALQLSGALIVSFAIPLEGGFAAAQPAKKPVDLGSVESFLAINPDGTVTVFSGKVDLGTGLRTALTQMVADELDVGFSKVVLIQGDTDLTPDQGVTFGSLSIQNGGMQLRQAAATARRALLIEAGRRFRVSPENLRIEDGLVHPPQGEPVPLAALLDKKGLSLKLDKTVPLKAPKDFKLVGKPQPRLDIPDKITGQFTYMQDFTLPGMYHGRVIRPPALGATLLSVDEASIADIPGIVKVVRQENFLGVVAKTEWAAIRGSRRLAATWSEWYGLPSRVELWEHVRHTKIVKDDVTSNTGDSAKALGEAKQRLAATYDFAIHTHGSIGPSCAVAQFDGDHLTCWSASQATHNLRKQLAAMFSFKDEQVHCVYIDGSGCYGRNGHEDAAADAALLAREVNAPVRVQWMRADEIAAHAKADPLEARLRYLQDERGKALLERLATLSAWRTWTKSSHGGKHTGHGLAYTKYEMVRTYVGVVCEVEVDRDSGEIAAKRIFVAHDCGQIINPDGLRNQIEGNVVQTVSRVLKEEILFSQSKVTSVDWASYPILRFPEVPEIVMDLIDRPDQVPWGAGEPTAAMVPGAIGNAVFDAIGVRLRSVPFTPAKVLAAIKKS
jgi:nicotinate dehydrogenase subunit B